MHEILEGPRSDCKHNWEARKPIYRRYRTTGGPIFQGFAGSGGIRRFAHRQDLSAGEKGKRRWGSPESEIGSCSENRRNRCGDNEGDATLTRHSRSFRVSTIKGLFSWTTNDKPRARGPGL